MKTKQNMRRLVAFTLATAVTLPQGSPALAASLEFTKASVIRLSEQRLTTALTQNGGESAEKQFPLLTMATKMSDVSTKTAEAMWKTQSMSMESDLVVPDLTLPVDSGELEKDGSDHTSPSDPAKDASDPKLVDGSGEGGPDVSTPSSGGESTSQSSKEKTDEPAADESSGTAGGVGSTVVDDDCSQDGSAADSKGDGADSSAPGGDETGREEETGAENQGPGEENTGAQDAESGDPGAGEGSGGQGFGDDDLVGENTDGATGDGLASADPSLSEDGGFQEPGEPSDTPVEEDTATGDEELLITSDDVPVAADLEEASGPVYQMYDYVLGYGLNVQYTDDNGMDADNNRSLLDYLRRFRVELDEPVERAYPYFGVNAIGFGGYGSRVYSSMVGTLVVGARDGDEINTTYLIFPSDDMLGRVPDYEFAGWYLYPYGATANDFAYANMPMDDYESIARKWRYGDLEEVPATGQIMRPVEPKELTAEALEAAGVDTSYARLGDTWDAGASYAYAGYRVLPAEEGIIDRANPVSFVGRWRKSGESRAVDASIARDGTIHEGGTVTMGEALTSAATLTAITTSGTTEPTTLTLYQEKIDGKSDSALTGTTFDRDIQEYWIRVGADVDKLDLEFHAAEIFYDYFFPGGSDSEADEATKDDRPSPVQIAWTFGDQSADHTQNITAAMLPMWERDEENWDEENEAYIPANNGAGVSAGYNNTAHSKWAVKGIDLLPSLPAQNGYVYNDITVTVMSPRAYEAYLKILAWDALTSDEKADEANADKAPTGEDLADLELTTTYTFHVQRLSDPTLTQAWGNTPAGMIMRDSWLNEQGSTSEARAYFEENLKFDDTLYPRGRENASGFVFRDTYTAKAWEAYGSNVDLDDTAIVVYLDSAFNDPGIALTDSEGYQVTIGDSKWTVERRLKLKGATTLSIPNLTAPATSQDVKEYWYNGTPGTVDGRLIPVTNNDDAGWETLVVKTYANDVRHVDYQIDLRGLSILPGIYTLEYRFIDPVTGATYDATHTSTGEGSPWMTDVGADGAGNFTRTLVVLPIPGDVDMDGVVTSADAEVLRENVKGDGQNGYDRTLGGVNLDTLNSNDPGAEGIYLFAYRVADVNHDGIVEEINRRNNSGTDADVLETLPVPKSTNISQEGRPNWNDYYYIPLPNDVTTVVERQEMETLCTCADDCGCGEGVACKNQKCHCGKTESGTPDTDETTKATLELVYLGKESGTRYKPVKETYTDEDGEEVEILYEDGYFTTTKGPQYSLNIDNIPETDKMQLWDTMWVGVKLTDGDKSALLKNKVVDTLTFTLVYDARYLEPVSVLSQSEWYNASLGLPGKSDTERWEYTLENYNLETTTGNTVGTVWSKGDYVFAGALESARDFTVYDTKVITPLETQVKAEGSGAENEHLRELVFSVKLDSGSGVGLDNSGEQWLLAVPFLMIQYPVDLDFEKVEMVAGMTDFAMVLRDATTSGGTGSNNGAMTTAAYNPLSEKIFGNATQNLATELVFANAGPDNIPLGRDTSVIYYIRAQQQLSSTDQATSVVYSTFFQADYGWRGVEQEDGTIVYDDNNVVKIPRAATIRNAPDWLTYQRSIGYIEGRPEEARTYDFTIAEYRFKLIVEQAPLHYWADSYSTYYGEDVYRGANSSDFTFSYLESDILSIEREIAESRGFVINGSDGAQLAQLLTLKKPEAAEALPEVPDDEDSQDDPEVPDDEDGQDDPEVPDDEDSQGDPAEGEAPTYEENAAYNQKYRNALTYASPTFTAVVGESGDNNRQPIQYNTDASDDPYDIISVLGKSNNYRFIYVSGKSDIDAVPDSVNRLTIRPRPFAVEQIIPPVEDDSSEPKKTKPVGSIYMDEDAVISGLSVQIGVAGAEFTFTMDVPEKKDSDAATGMYDGLTLKKHTDDEQRYDAGGMLLVEDSLVLQYMATVLQEPADEAAEAAGEGRYKLAEISEPRYVDVSGLQIVSREGTSYQNYTIVSAVPKINGREANVVANVLRRNIIAFEIVNAPDMVRQTGDRLSDYGELWFNIRKEGDGPNSVEGTYQYNPETTLSQLGVTVCWAMPDEDGNLKKDEDGRLLDTIPYTPNQTFTMEFNGRYLCLYTERTEDGQPLVVSFYYATVDEDGNRIPLTDENDEPIPVKLTVTPRLLTLTAKETSRFYGEENGDLGFTYYPQQLSVQDQQILRDVLGISDIGTLPRDGAELQLIFNEKWRRDRCTCEDDEGCACANGGACDNESCPCGQPVDEVNPYYTAPALKVVDVIEARTAERGGWVDLLHPDADPEKPNIVTDVVAESQAGDATYVVLIYGAASSEYDIQYTRTYGSGNLWTTDEDPYEEWGTSRFHIERRLIVVDALRANDKTRNLVTIYADSKKLDVEMNGADEVLNPRLELGDVVMTLPEDDNGTVGYYRLTNGEWVWTTSSLTYAEKTAVLDDDLYLTYTATVVSQDGASYVYWTNFAKGYFDMSDADEENGSKKYPVQVSDLVLGGKASVNYELVYVNYTSASAHGPSQWETVRGILPEARSDWPYYIPTLVDVDKTTGEVTPTEWKAEGTVTLRPIESIQILSPGRLKYTYGDTYLPDGPDGSSGPGMTIHIEYATTYDHWSQSVSKNVTAQDLEFAISDPATGVSTFDERGLVIQYKKDDVTGELDYGDALSVGDHNGASLRVGGKRGEQADYVWSDWWKDLQDSAPEKNTLTVQPKTLTLRADDQYRVYGEENDTPTFTFSMTELAARDRALLLAEDPSLTGRISGEWLKQLATTGTGSFPAFAHTALDGFENGRTDGSGPRSDVGEYPIVMSQSGEGYLSNYTLSFQGGSGTLYIYPRRIQIASFKKYKDENIKDNIEDNIHDIYTIYTDMSNRIVSQAVYLGEFQEDPAKPDTKVYNDFKVEIADTDTKPYLVQLPSREWIALPMTHVAEGENGLIKGDAMALSVTVEYVDPDLGKEGVTKTHYDVEVTDAYLSVSSSNKEESERALKNYVLDTSGGKALIIDGAAKGGVELRSISEVVVDSVPANLHYTYGDTLDLWGLTVSVYYTVSGAGQSGVGSTKIIYRQNEDFTANGLHLNYYPSPTALPEDEPSNTWENLPDKYYTASTGDHVTIAPTHVSALAAVANDPDGEISEAKKNFSTDGQYLVISAQREQGQQPARPVIVKDPKTEEAVQITVEPKKVTVSLEAADKTYDGTVEAAGTATLNGIFHEKERVDSYYPEGLTDVVYLVTGAGYESLWNTTQLTEAVQEDFDAYLAAHNDSYAFTTGTYAGPATDPLARDTAIDWTGEGADEYYYYAPNVMRFAFLGADVAYEEEQDFHQTIVNSPQPVAQPVEVRGLRLAGPDAANYVLEIDHVGQDNVNSDAYESEDGALPQATIYKANRLPLMTSGLPTVEVDPNTNVVRIVYDYDPSVVAQKGESTAHISELHFEYALQYQSKESAQENEDGTVTVPTSVVNQWAGADGKARAMWGQETYFGGEAVSLDYPEGYVPREEDLPNGNTGEDAMALGQVYQWADRDTGFRIDPGAYLSDPADWPDYYLYTTDRTALDRNTVYWGLVRVAETHNYNASPVLSSVAAYDARMAQDVLDAWTTIRNGTYDRESLERASSTALAAVARAQVDAVTAAEAEKDLMAEIAESGDWPETWINRAAAPAVKTYTQRLDLISVESLRSAEAASQSSNEDYQVPTLEAVWFTDVLEYAGKEGLDAVARNMDPVRYYSYAWDADKSAILFQDPDEPLNLSGPVPVEITRRDEGGGEITGEVMMNLGNIAQLYVDLSAPVVGGSATVRSIRINSEDLELPLDTEPFQLTATILPKDANQTVLWTSSDESVAYIDEEGWVTIVGVGETVITAMATNKLSDSILITVVEEEEEEEPGTSLYPDGIFNDLLVDAFFPLDESDWLFHPDWVMTRGEVAQLLARFYVENPTWTKTGPDYFADITGEEPYAEAVLTLSTHGVIQGMPGGTFNGELIISRAEFITLLVRMMGIEVPDTTGQEHAFRDTGEEGTWAYSEIDAMSKVPGVLLGVGEGDFAPGRALTREEAAAFLCRLLQFPEVGEDPLIPRDVEEDFWSRDPILRAINLADREKPRFGQTEETDGTEGT